MGDACLQQALTSRSGCPQVIVSTSFERFSVGSVMEGILDEGPQFQLLRVRAGNQVFVLKRLPRGYIAVPFCRSYIWSPIRQSQMELPWSLWARCFHFKSRGSAGGGFPELGLGSSLFFEVREAAGHRLHGEAMCSPYFSIITHTAEKTLEDYLAFFQAIVIADLLLVVLYTVHIAFHMALMDSDNHTASCTDMLVLVLGTCVVLLWLVDAALSMHFGSRVRKASISDTVNPEKVDALVHRNRVCIAVGSFALTIYLARFCVELLKAREQGQMDAMQECIVVLAPVLFVKVIRLLAFHSFGCWVRRTAGTASV